MVFEHLPAHDESPGEPASEKKEDEPSVVGGAGEVGMEGGGKEGRKQWGQGQGPPVIELLQHKQLQTATYAVDDGNTGSLSGGGGDREGGREHFWDFYSSW